MAVWHLLQLQNPLAWIQGHKGFWEGEGEGRQGPLAGRRRGDRAKATRHQHH